MADEERRSGVNREHPVPLFRCHIRERPILRHSSAVHQKVDASQSLCCFFHNALGGFHLGKIRHDAVGLNAFSLPRDLLQTLPVPPHERQVESKPAKFQRDGLPNTPGSPCDECYHNVFDLDVHTKLAKMTSPVLPVSHF